MSESKTQIIKEYNSMIAHMKMANEHQKLANEIAARLGVLLDPFQDPAPKRGKSVVSPEVKAEFLARRRRSYEKYERIESPIIQP